MAVLERVEKVASVKGVASMIIAALSTLMVVLPIAFIVITLFRSPDPVPILSSLFPEAFESLSVLPNKLPQAIPLAL